MTDAIENIQVDAEAMALALAAGTTTMRGIDGKVEPWRVEHFKPLAEKIVRLLDQDREERDPVPIEVCNGEFRLDERGHYVCKTCGRVVGPHQFHEIRTAGFGPHWFDEDKQRLRFDAPPEVTNV